MHFVSVEKCPISGRSGVVAYSGVEDAYFSTPGEWTYRRDPGSGHLWLDPRPADDSIGELYAAYYTHDATVAHAESLWEKAIQVALHDGLGYPAPAVADWKSKLVSRLPSVRAAAELEVMRISAKQQGRLLDYGCGSGAFLKRMRSHGWSVVGVEPDASSAARVAQAENLAVFSSIEEVLSKDSAPFDVITMSHVIEHLPDPVEAIRSLRRLLAAGGRLIVTTPNAASLGHRLFAAQWRGLEPPRHFNVFTPQSLQQAMKFAGYSSVTLRTDVRLARGMWFLSALAREGKRGLEISPRPHRPGLKIGGYLFQVLEAAFGLLFPQVGEEIFCAAVAMDAS